MSELRRRYCIFGCDSLVAYGVPLHRFPNPDNRPDLFVAWIAAVGSKVKERDCIKIYKNKRICDHHFDPTSKTSGGRLICSAVPTVNLNRVQQTIKTFVESDHSYCRPRREPGHTGPMFDIINLPGSLVQTEHLHGPSRSGASYVLECTEFSGTSRSTCLTSSEKCHARTPLTFVAGKTSKYLQKKAETQCARKERQMQNEAMLEVCIDSLESAINAIHGGADELEICSSLTEGGLTPSPGLVKQIMEMVNNIAAGKPIRKSCHDCGCDKLTKRPKVNVMIRCRTGSDFHYSEEEMDTMLSDVDVFKAFGVDRFVFGALTETQHMDEINCQRLIHQADHTPVTFHRAFDVCLDPVLSIIKIAELGFNRLLTSGQKPTAIDVEAIQLIMSLNSRFGDKVEIMPGAGINLGNAKTFIDIGCKIVHSSCKRIRYLPQIMNGLSMGTSDSEHVFVTDENIVKKMKEIINQN